MKITSVSVRRLSISSAPWYGGEIPAGQPKSFQFPLLEIKTDDGHAGHSMGYCPLGQGRGASYQLADIYPRILLGRNPLAACRT